MLVASRKQLERVSSCNLNAFVSGRIQQRVGSVAESLFQEAMM